MVGYRVVCIVGVVAIIATFPKPTRQRVVRVMRVRVLLHIPVYQLVHPCWLVGGPWALLSAPRRLAWGMQTPSTARDGYSGQERIKGMESTGRIHTPIHLPSCAHLVIFFLRFWASKFSLAIATMTSHLPRSPPPHQG
jgi:hypothetical protein